MERQVAIGQLLREKRLERGWSVETVAELYGNAIQGEPITGGAIFNMEEGTVPKGRKRRWILARMLDIAPAALGLEALEENKGKIPDLLWRRSRSVDVSEYQTTLHTYWKQGYQRSPESALKDLGQRIYALHDNAYYVRSPQRDQMKRLLCGYHLQRAEVAEELSYNSSALDHLNKAIILATEEGFADLEAATLYRRGEFFFDKWDFQRALQDLKAAQSKKGVLGLVRGRILSSRGNTDAYLARTDAEMTKAMKWVDDSEHYITSNDDPENDIPLSFNEVRYLLDRGQTLLAPSEKKLHLTDEAYDISTEILKKSDSTQKRIHAYYALVNNIILARYYLDKSYYPIATTLTEEALSQIKNMNSTAYLPAIVHLYEELKESSYGKSVEIAELGLQLLFVQCPSL